MTTADDDDRVRELLGRAPEGRYRVVVRDAAGEPVVIENAPLLDDGRPMPTRYWLIGKQAVIAVSRIEAAGGVRAAEAAVDADELAAAHARYAALRDADVPDDAELRPSGGVGGTRQGVKCLHAHYAWHLAGGDDPVGRWVADELAGSLDITVDLDEVTLRHGGLDIVLPVNPAALGTDELAGSDPPRPEALTNGLGAVIDAVDDEVRLHPELLEAGRVRFAGTEAWHLLQVERGVADPRDGTTVDRDDLEDLFRTLATERRADRLHNPALDPERVDVVVATCCVVLGVMRRLHVDAASFRQPPRPVGTGAADR